MVIIKSTIKQERACKYLVACSGFGQGGVTRTLKEGCELLRGVIHPTRGCYFIVRPYIFDILKSLRKVYHQGGVDNCPGGGECVFHPIN